ncbi:hypothetical protein [Lysobacter rhizosphaerae]
MVVIAVVHFISPLIQPIATRLYASLAKAHDFLRHVFQFMPDVRFTHSEASSSRNDRRFAADPKCKMTIAPLCARACHATKMKRLIAQRASGMNASSACANPAPDA